MPKITVFTRDSCRKDITGQDYQTITMRRYSGQKHEKVIRFPAMWLCDKCYKRMALYMAFPPYDAEEEE